MKHKPINPVDGHPNRHTLIIGCSGSGKSQFLVGGKLVPEGQGVRLIMWDDVGRLKGNYYRTRAGFLKALRAALVKGGGFRIGYGGPQTPEEFEWWCSVCWAILDGKKTTYMVAEELAAVSPNAGRAPPMAGMLLNQSRKYGGIFIGTTQRPEEVSKTYFTQAGIKVIGQQNSPAMVRKAATWAGVTEQQIRDLQPLSFYRNEGGASGGQLVKVRYKKPSNQPWHD